MDTVQDEQKLRNPQGLKPGDHVEVTGAGHAQIGKRGIIHELLGVVIEHGKPRASIELDDYKGFIYVSLRNLTKIEKGE